VPAIARNQFEVTGAVRRRTHRVAGCLVYDRPLPVDGLSWGALASSHAGDVDEFAVAAVGAGGDGDDAAGAQDRGGAGEDLGEPVGEVVGLR
jgi:hypothetical protein